MIIEREEPGKFTLSATLQDDGYYNVNFHICQLMAQRIKDEYYKAEKKFLKQRGFRKGKVPRKLMESRMGGEEGAYSASFMTYANTKWFEYAPSKVMYTRDYESKKDDNGWTITFKSWIEPQVEVPDNIFDKEFEIPKLDVDEYIDYRLRAFSKLHPYLHIKESEAAEGDMVEVSIQATIDEKEFKDGSHESVNIRLLRDAVNPPSLFDKLIGVVPGVGFSIETSNAQDLPAFKANLKNNQNFKMNVNVIRIYTCEESTIDDDLAITAGFDSLKEWKDHLCKIGKELTKGREEVRKKELLLSHVTDLVPVPDLPSDWAKEKAIECVRANLVPHDSPAVRDALLESARHITILKAIGNKLSIEWDDKEQDIQNRDESVYTDKVLKQLLTMAHFKYVDPTPEDSLIQKING